MTKRRFLLVLVVIIVAVVAYLVAWPVPINPAAWMPPPAPELTGVYAPNSELSKIERLKIESFGPEDIAFDSQDRIYCGADDGRIFRFQADGTKPEVFAQTKGRPLGLVFDHGGNLIVADAMIGLMSIAPDRRLQGLESLSRVKGADFEVVDTGAKSVEG